MKKFKTEERILEETLHFDHVFVILCVPDFLLTVSVNSGITFSQYSQPNTFCSGEPA
jgi:hypothetical protein